MKVWAITNEGRFIVTKRLYSKNLFLLTGIIASAAIWLIESLFHYLFFDSGSSFELIPHDWNELWMRSVICILIIIAGVLAQWYVDGIVSIEEQKLNTLKVTMRTVQDIVGNALNNLLLLRVQGKESGQLDDQALAEIDRIISDTSTKLNKLATVQVIKNKELLDGIEVIEYE